MSATADQARLIAVDMESRINAMLNEFREKTGLRISRIEINEAHDCFGRTLAQAVCLEVRL